MSLRQSVEDAFLIQFANNEQRLKAERAGANDAELIARYEDLRAELMPIVTEIVANRRVEAG